MKSLARKRGHTRPGEGRRRQVGDDQEIKFSAGLGTVWLQEGARRKRTEGAWAASEGSLGPL